MTSLEAKLRTAAAANSGLTALLGTSPFRWFDTQLEQGAALPAIAVLLISNPSAYGIASRMTTSFSRMQFTIWGTSGQQARDVEAALVSFLDGFNAYGIPNLPQNANFVVGSRGGMFAQSHPPKYLRILDAQVFNNEAVN